MNRATDILLTAMAPAIWGSTYYVTTEFLPDGYPVTVSMLRTLPAGLFLLLLVRRLPPLSYIGKVTLLGVLNFTIFQSMLFAAAYRLPGGVAATVGAVQPLFVILIAYLAIGTKIRTLSVIAAAGGIAGVALLVLTPEAALDSIGIVAGLAGALSMAGGTVLSRKWKPDVSPLAFTAWQLTAGGVLLVPLALWMEPPLPPLSGTNIVALSYLCLIGAAFTYVLWLRGVGRMEPSAVSTLGFLSPATALVLGWALLEQHVSPLQGLGILVVLGSVWLGQNPGSRARLSAAAS